jgi:hypothetical protein
MADRLRKFLADVKAAREQSAADQAALLGRLKTLTPEEFVLLSRETVQELSDKQYAEVIQHVAPAHRLAEPKEVAPKKVRRWSLRLLWSAVSTQWRAAIAALAVGFLILGATLALGPAMEWWSYRVPPVRTVAAWAWPHCHRLSRWVDGCTYTPTDRLAWEQAASLLAMSEKELREVNKHIAARYIPAGAMLVVWRGRTTLLEDNR